MLTVDNVKTKRGAVKRYNAIIAQCRKNGKGGLKYGLDMPTLNVLWPDRYAEIMKLKRMYSTLPD